MTESDTTQKEHVLKCHPDFFRHLLSGDKTFELRYDDRAYRSGDILDLREWSSATGYTGRSIKKLVSYVLSGEPWLQPNYVAMGLQDA